MKIVLLKLTALAFLTISTTACSTYRNDVHGTDSTGVRVDGNLDFLGVGIDVGANAGLHATGVGVPVQGGIPSGVIMQGGGRTPCAPTHRAMMESEGLIGWASANGQGATRRFAQANAHDSSGYAGYSCFATNAGSSTLMNGQVVVQNDRPWLNQEQGYRQEYGQPRRR